MKHTITLWHVEAEGAEAEVFTFWDLDVDPFNVGMYFYLNLEDYYPADENKMLSSGWTPKTLNAFLKEWKIKTEKYNNKLVKLTEKHSSLKLKDSRFRTDYYLKIINPK